MRIVARGKVAAVPGVMGELIGGVAEKHRLQPAGGLAVSSFFRSARGGLSLITLNAGRKPTSIHYLQRGYVMMMMG